MEMEFMAEFTEGMSRDRALQIIKRKRTKRNRPCSSGSSDGENLNDYYYKADHSSSEVSTKEDEDMANCLIMLAQSVSTNQVVNEEKSDPIRSIRQKTERLNSRRFTEINVATSRADLYVYECKTCNRTFNSFQALGGHRASHKKPKGNVEEKKTSPVNNINKMAVTMAIDYDKIDEDINSNNNNNNNNNNNDDNNHNKLVGDDDDEENKAIIITTNDVNKSPSQTRTINNKIKVHECSICGSEFLSGQALGGHMRKHRPIPPTNNRNGISTTNDESTIVQITEKSNSSSSGMLSLDLNFPPPEMVEDHRQTFPFTAGSSSQHLVFSAPAFVDCHY